MDPLAEGLRVSAVGITLVFAALGLLVLLLTILQRVSSWHLGTEQLEEPSIDARERADEETTLEELQRAAATAVAVMKARGWTGDDASLGDLLQQPASSWWDRSGTLDA